MTKVKYKTHEFRCSSKGLLERVVEICLQFPKSAKILDLGCGRGGALKLLQENGFTNIIGADMNVHQSGHLRNLGITVIPINLNKKKIVSGKYDVVISTEVIEHVENPTKLFDDCFHLLNKSGHLIISTPNNQNWFGRIFFLLTGKFPNFSGKLEDDHRTPIFDWQFGFLTRGKFKLIGRYYNRIASPILHFQIPTTKHLLGDNAIYLFKKI